MVTLNQLRAAYAESVKNNENIQQLADRLKMKLTSLNQRLNGIRKDLRDSGATEEQVQLLFPPLSRRPTTRQSSVKETIAAMLAEVSAKPPEGAPHDEVPQDSLEEIGVLQQTIST